MVDVIIKDIITNGSVTGVVATDLNGNHRVRLNFNTSSFLHMPEREIELILEHAVEGEMQAKAFTMGEVNPIEEKANAMKAKSQARAKELLFENEESKSNT